MRTKKITLQFHYGPSEITPTIREYMSPPKPEYGCEIKFNEAENVVDMVSGRAIEWKPNLFQNRSI